MKVIIAVTKKDIADGVCFDAEKCPVSLAVKRHLRSPVRVSTNNDVDASTWCNSGLFTNRISFKVKGGMLVIQRLPAGVAARVNAYDKGKGMKPFSFTLQTPD